MTKPKATTMPVTDIRDAKAFREMGVPLNTPVIDGGELPAPAAKAMEDGFKAAMAFRRRIYAYGDNPNASTFAALKRAFQRFMSKTVSDDPIGAALLESEFASIRAEWSDVFEAGERIEVGPPMWPWEPTEATKMRQRNPGL
jgi:hypothetical protein